MELCQVEIDGSDGRTLYFKHSVHAICLFVRASCFQLDLEPSIISRRQDNVEVFRLIISIDNDYCHCGITYRGPGFDVNYAASFVLQVKRDPMSVPVHRIVV